MPASLPQLRNADALGRGVFSSNQARSAKKGIMQHSIFFEHEDAQSLSVDRLNHAPDQVMAEIGDRIARSRGPNRSFYGWAEVALEDASKNGRTVAATPLPDNPYHADIYLNVPASSERRDDLIDHANNLAAAAEWRKRP